MPEGVPRERGPGPGYSWTKPEVLLVNPTTQFVAALAATPAETIPSAMEPAFISREKRREVL